MEAIASAEQLLAQGRFEDAHQASLRILAREPGSVKALLVRAAACAALRRLDEAERSARAVLQASPRDPSGRYLLAQITHLAGPPERALSALAHALANDHGAPDETDPWRVAGIAIEALAGGSPAAAWQSGRGLFERFGVMLAQARPEPDGATLREIAASRVVERAPAEFAARLKEIERLLGFGRLAPPEWNRVVVEGVFVPWMRRAAAEGRPMTALVLEQVVYEGYVKQTESETHFHDAFALWKDELRAAGARFAASLPEVPRGPPGPLPRVAFFVHNLTLLAHAQILLDTLLGHAALEAPLVEPGVFCFTGTPAAIERFRTAGVRVEELAPPTDGTILDAFVRLRERIAAEGIGTLVWVSAAVWMPFAFGMRLAPRQVWWAMKYHALEMPEIDGYVTGGSQTGGTKTIHGREWRAGPVASAAAEWLAPEKAPAARAVRDSLGTHGPVYGSFGREEKLNSPEFLDAVVAILRRVPAAVFLWTGRLQHPDIQRRFESAGVAARCRFIGWVDTKLYAQVIDVFLDSFPFPCGFTLYEAMAAGKPVVLFASSASDHTGINALVAPLLRAAPTDSKQARLAHEIFRPAPGTELYLRHADAPSYVESAVRLGEDEAFRKRAGEAARLFVERVMTDREEAARMFVDHFLGR